MDGYGVLSAYHEKTQNRMMIWLIFALIGGRVVVSVCTVHAQIGKRPKPHSDFDRAIYVTSCRNWTGMRRGG
jgi:hypothetical protein